MSGDVTTVATVPPTVTGFAPEPAPQAVSPPRLMTETQALLRIRLRMATFLLLMGFLIFFVRNLLLTDRVAWLAVFHGFVVIVLAAAVARLSLGTSPSLGQLRTIEAAVFGLITVFLASAQYHIVLARARENEATLALAAIKNTVLYVFALMTIYGVFIPNHWRRAALILLPIALTPTLVLVLLSLAHPELNVVNEHVVSIRQIVDNELMLVLGAGTSIFGTHIINTLRNEAFAARQIGQYRLGRGSARGAWGGLPRRTSAPQAALRHQVDSSRSGGRPR